MKQVIILRTDLKMGKGKSVAQGAHASVKAALFAKEPKKYFLNSAQIPNVKERQMNQNRCDEWSQWFEEWDQALWNGGGYKKIALKLQGEENLFHIAKCAYDAQLPVFLVQDAGLTQIKTGTFTACAIGPCPEKLVDLFTKDLKLL